MDVVNEAINNGAGTDRVTGNEWYTTFGDNTFIMKAFEFARKYTVMYGETQMKLYYNDYNTHVAAKANGIVRLCGPVFGPGSSMGSGCSHDQMTTPTAAEWIASYTKFDTICTEMAVTELDVATGLASPGFDTPPAGEPVWPVVQVLRRRGAISRAGVSSSVCPRTG